jgi:hypothetical protein
MKIRRSSSKVFSKDGEVTWFKHGGLYELIINHLRVWASVRVSWFFKGLEHHLVCKDILPSSWFYHHQGFHCSFSSSFELGLWPLVNPNQCNSSNQGFSKRWGIFLGWGSHDCNKGLTWARVSFFEQFPQVVEAQVDQGISRSSEDQKVNCVVNWGLWGGEMSWDTSIMSKWGLLIILNIHLEDSKVMAKVTKNGKWPIIQSFQIWQVFGPLSTWLFNIKEVSNGSLVIMKVIDLCLPFPKSPNSCPYDEWLRSYGHLITRCAWKFKMA